MKNQIPKRVVVLLVAMDKIEKVGKPITRKIGHYYEYGKQVLAAYKYGIKEWLKNRGIV